MSIRFFRFLHKNDYLPPPTILQADIQAEILLSSTDYQHIHTEKKKRSRHTNIQVAQI